MTTFRTVRAAPRLLALLAAVLLASCQGLPPAVETGRQMLSAGRFEDGLALLEAELRARPHDTPLRQFYMTQRDRVILQLVGAGELARGLGQIDEAELFFRRALKIDARNARAVDGLRAVETDRRHAKQVLQAELLLRKGDAETARELLREVLVENPQHRDARRFARRADDQLSRVDTRLPQLKTALAKPITMEFRDAPLRQVFEVLARTAGLNFVFDRDVRPDLRTSIFVRNSNVEDVIRLLLLTNQLDRKVLNENSLLIYPNTPAKQKEYQDTIVRSFFLSNSEAKQAVSLLRTIAKTRDVFFDDKINLLVVKDTPDAIRLAEKLIRTQDVPEPEVVLQVEVMEVARNQLQELGVRFPDRILFGATDDAGRPLAGGAQVPLSSQLTATALNPLYTLHLRAADGATTLLSNPRIRVRNRDKARIHIGEKVPVFTTTAVAAVGATASVSFLDVGLKLDVSPVVFLEDEVQISVALEVSNIIREVPGPAGTLAYQLGTRNTTTTLRIRDGETQILAGLLNDEDRTAANRVPGIGKLPVVGRLFSSTLDTRTRTEIVLLITPHIVRNIERPEFVDAEFFAGTDTAIGAQPIRIRPTAARALSLAPGGAAGAAAKKPGGGEAAGAAAPAVAQLLWAAPAEVPAGGEFTVALGLPPGAAAGGQIQLVFDPKLLEVIKPAERLEGVEVSLAPGRVSLVYGAVAGAPAAAAELRFRVLAKGPAKTEFAFSALGLVDWTGAPVPLVPQPAHALAIVLP
jgi:general secretion pathway protein D